MGTLVRTAVAALAALAGAVLVSPVVLVALPLWAVSALVRALLPRLRPATAPWKELIDFEPEVGWRPRPDLEACGSYVSGVFRLTTDGEGWRGRASLDESEVVVFGDSYAFGHGIDDGEYFAHVDPGLRVKAIGMNGYNMVQGLLWMRRLAPRLRGKLVVWWVYCGNDLYENLTPNHGRWRMPFLREDGAGGWQIVTAHVRRDPWIETVPRDYQARLAEICSPTPLARRAFSAAEFLIAEGQRLCAAAGAELVVMTLPERSQVDATRRERLAAVAPGGADVDPALPDRTLGRICERLGVPFVSLAGRLTVRDFLEYDPHWNLRGHRKVARVLSELRRGEPFATPPDVVPTPVHEPRPRAAVALGGGR